MTSKSGALAHVLEKTFHIDVDQAVLRDIAGDIEWRKVKAFTVEEYLQQVESGRAGLYPAGMTV